MFLKIFFAALRQEHTETKVELGKPVGRLLQLSRREMMMTWARMVARRNDSAEEKAGDAGERKQIS